VDKVSAPARARRGGKGARKRILSRRLKGYLGESEEGKVSGRFGEKSGSGGGKRLGKRKGTRIKEEDGKR